MAASNSSRCEAESEKGTTGPEPMDAVDDHSSREHSKWNTICGERTKHSAVADERAERTSPA